MTSENGQSPHKKSNKTFSFLKTNHGPTAQNKHGAHYVGLIESDERWKTVYSVWPYQVKFSGYPNF